MSTDTDILSDQETVTAGQSDAVTPVATPEIPVTSSSRGSARKNKKKAPQPKSALGKMRFGLTPNTERALRYATFMLEDTANSADAQQLVEESVLAHLKKLRSKGMEFPKSILPE